MRKCPACHAENIGLVRLVWRGTCSRCGAGLATSLIGLEFFFAYAIAAAVTPRGLPLFEHMWRFALVAVPIATLAHFASAAWAPLRVRERIKPWREHSASEKIVIGGSMVVILAVIAFAVFRAG